MTAIAIRAFLESHRGHSEFDGAFITRPVAFLLGKANDDSSISESIQNHRDITATALVALQATRNERHRDSISVYLALEALRETSFDPESPRLGPRTPVRKPGRATTAANGLLDRAAEHAAATPRPALVGLLRVPVHFELR